MSDYQQWTLEHIDEMFEIIRQNGVPFELERMVQVVDLLKRLYLQRSRYTVWQFFAGLSALNAKKIMHRDIYDDIVGYFAELATHTGGANLGIETANVNQERLGTIIDKVRREIYLGN